MARPTRGLQPETRTRQHRRPARLAARKATSVNSMSGLFHPLRSPSITPHAHNAFAPPTLWRRSSGNQERRNEEPAPLGATNVSVLSFPPEKISASTGEGAQVKRGDASINGHPGVAITVTKQPRTDTRALTDATRAAFAEVEPSLPADVVLETGLYELREFIDRGVYNVGEALVIGAVLVLIVLFLFLLNFRTTFISLTAIPLSLVVTVVVFKLVGLVTGTELSINVMTLGGIAVALGELVDDAIVDVENIFRRLRENNLSPSPKPALRVVYDASVEVRTPTVACLFSLSLALEAWSVGRARRAVAALMDLTPPAARLLHPDGREEEVPPDRVPVGARFRVRPGDRLPLDGRVVEGSGGVDQAPITGESVPVAKGPGDEVYAGTINGDGALTVESTKPASDTTLARITRMVGEAQSRRSPSEQWVETFARYYTPAVMAAALLVLVVPPLAFDGAWAAWLYRALVLLVIACPCALVISTPVTIVAALASAARNGVLIKGGVYVEAPARLKAVAMDKTGTLTQGKPAVVEVVPLNGHTEAELLERAAALEAQSTHPLAHAITAHAMARGVTVPPVEDFRIIPGKGATGRVGGTDYWVGSHRHLEERGQETPEVHDRLEALARAGRTVVVVGTDAAIETADIALMSDDLTKLPWLVGHSRRALAVIRQNIVFALGVKAVFVVLTFAGYSSMWGAIAADTGASLLVVFNGLRLLRTGKDGLSRNAGDGYTLRPNATRAAPPGGSP